MKYRGADLVKIEAFLFITNAENDQLGMMSESPNKRLKRVLIL
jgi:hypothetical protein